MKNNKVYYYDNQIQFNNFNNETSMLTYLGGNLWEYYDENNTYNDTMMSILCKF